MLKLTLEEMEQEWNTLVYYAEREWKDLETKLKEEIEYLKEIEEYDLIEYYLKRAKQLGIILEREN